jgi:hypothetical protein
LTLIRLFLAFVLTLLLFWISSRFDDQHLDKQYFDAAADRFLIDHTSVGRHSTASDPQISVWIATPADTSAFALLLFYRQTGAPVFFSQAMTRMTGSYDLYSATLPRLVKGESYEYHIKLQTDETNTIARLPREEAKEIRLLFEGKPSLVVWAAYIGLMYLAAMYAFSALFDALRLRSAHLRLKGLSRKVLAATFLFVIGGLVVGSVVSASRFGYFWGGWPLGGNGSQTLIEMLIVSWIALTMLFKGTIFRFRPEKNIVSAGMASVLTLIGVLFMIVVYLAGNHFVGIPL